MAETHFDEARRINEATPPAKGCAVLLCSPELQPRYEAALAADGRTVRGFETVEALLADCVQRPPSAILLDMNAVTRLGAMATAPLFELDVDWPILRCTLLPDGGANFMCLDPLRFGSLGDALNEIAAGDGQWKRPGRRRGALRLDLACRVGVRRADETNWTQANCLNISVGGLFAVTYHPYAMGETVELELRDLGSSRLRLWADIVRTKPWDTCPDLPGIGVRFHAAEVTEEFTALLARPEHVQRLISGCRKKSAVASESLVEKKAANRALAPQATSGCDNPPLLQLAESDLLAPALQTFAESPQ